MDFFCLLGIFNEEICNMNSIIILETEGQLSYLISMFKCVLLFFNFTKLFSILWQASGFLLLWVYLCNSQGWQSMWKKGGGGKRVKTTSVSPGYSSPVKCFNSSWRFYWAHQTSKDFTFHFTVFLTVSHAGVHAEVSPSRLMMFR